MSDDRMTSDEIREDIETTRQHLARDLDELSYRVSPEGLKARALGTLEEAQVAAERATFQAVDRLDENAQQLGERIVEAIRRNPLPATIVGAGLGWVLLRSSDTPDAELEPADHEYADHEYHAPEGYAVETSGRNVELRDRNRDLYPVVDSDAPTGLTGWLREHPIAAGAAVLAAGALIGALIPRTKREEAVVSDARHRLMMRMERAQRDIREHARAEADAARLAGTGYVPAERTVVEPTSGTVGTYGAVEPDEVEYETSDGTTVRSRRDDL